MDDIKAILSGKLSRVYGLSGNTSNNIRYAGDYSVTPKAFENQTLATAQKLLEKDIVINEIPYFETSNDSNGITAYIAKEV